MKKTICLLILTLSVCALYGQFADRQVNFPQISSPNVASFNKFIDHPISLYNGTPDVSIPLYTLNDGIIELPIALRYNTSGIKVTEEASWVGLGWNLNIGGVIHQNILGYCDEEDTEYNNFLNTPEFSPFFSSEPINGYFRLPYTLPIHKKIGAIVTKRAWYSTHGMAKLEPDVFYFSYPGNAGKFIIDYRTNKVCILSREQNLKIDFTVNPRQFTITTTEGIKHTFTRMFDVIRDGIESVSYGLTSSLYPNNQTVFYEYEIINNRSFNQYENFDVAYYDVGETIRPGSVGYGPSPFVNDRKEYSGKEIILRNIKTTNYEVTFITDSRSDLPKSTLGKKLIEIKITSTDKINQSQNKRFILNYDYFLANHSGDNWGVKGLNGEDVEKDWAGKRLKLLGVYELSDNVENNKYDFFYQENPLLPRKDSYAVDYWGYYNGRWQNKRLIPDLEKLLFSDPINYTKVLEAFRRHSENRTRTGDRTYDFDFCKAGMLTGIKYPTGGYVEFEFEPNTFSDFGALGWQQSFPPNVGGGSLGNEYRFIPTYQEYFNGSKISLEVKDQNSPQAIATRQFIIEEKCTVEITAVLSRGNHTWQYLDQLGHFVYIKKINGTQKTTVKEIKTPATGSGTERSITTYIELEPGTYEVVADISDALGNLLSGDYYYFNTALKATISYPKPKSSYLKFSTGCGIRIKNINHFESKDDTNPIITTSYDYSNPLTNNSSGMLHDVLNYMDISKRLCSMQIASPSGSTATTTLLYAPYIVSLYSNNTVSNPYGNSSGVGYTYVKEIKKGPNNVGYTISKFKNEAGIYRYRQGGVKIDNPLNGKLEERSVYNEKGTLSEKSKYNYIATPSNSYWSITFKDTKFTDVDKWVIPAHEWGVFYSMYDSDPYNLGGLFGDRVLIYKTEIKSYDITLTSKEMTKDGIVTKEDYIYNPSTLQLKSKNIIADSNNTLAYSYTYPNDFNCGIYSIMTSKNIISNIVEEKIFRNNGYIGGSLTEYAWDKKQKFIKPSKKRFAEIPSKLTNPTTFNCNGPNSAVYPYENVLYKEYDDFGNPLHISKDGVLDFVYLWSYNYQYPIAEIKNATYIQVRDALGGQTIVDNIAKSIVLSDTDKTKINNLRTNASLAGALVTTYTYKPLVGMLSATDPSGITTYYDYDSFGRLKETYIYKDNVITPANKQIIQKYDYHYQNQ